MKDCLKIIYLSIMALSYIDIAVLNSDNKDIFVKDSFLS